MRTALIFPGFGAFYPAAFSGCAEAETEAEPVITEVDEVTARYGLPSVREALLGAPDAEAGAGVWDCRDTRALEIFAGQVVCHRILRRLLGVREQVVCGHSLGEYAALVAAEGLTVRAAAQLLCERITAVRSHTVPAGRMLAVPLSRERARRLAAQETDVVIAAVNAPEQVVLSGPAERIDRVREAALAAGVRAVRLRTDPCPHHHPLLTPVFRHCAAASRPVPRQRPSRPVYGPVLGRAYLPCDDLAETLALQMVLPVDFARAVRDLYDDGIRLFIECGLKHTLSDLVEAGVPDARTLAPFRTRLNRERLCDASTEIRAGTTTGGPACPLTATN
ncbi:ACP S-malonyltransferase [Streptomyces sp. WELS2]|uniref:ACP S-malonyltransferase n=1 Tax=Streptomyces sp. WELS2 TaxID=2749435 RepID=UPI0015F04F82|nr:acyltransferase domain-containing protein [Streptomyces sp. WELS2]